MRYPPPPLGAMLLVLAPLLVVMDRGRRRAHGRGARRDRALLQGRIAALEAQIARLECEARDVDGERDEFLATLSHELRSPLNAMLGWIELLRVHLKEPAQQARALDVIERNARMEVRLIGDLLDLARLVTNRLCIERRPLSLGDVARQAADSVKETAAARGIPLHVDCPADVLATGDPARLLQAIAHLLHNALKFTEPGGIVRVTLRQQDGQAIIDVADTGIGMGGETLPHVFDRFRQAERGLTRRFGGLGVGLTIVRAIVELHGGTVHATSAGPGRGSTFTIRLPAASSGPRLAHRRVCRGHSSPQRSR